MFDKTEMVCLIVVRGLPLWSVAVQPTYLRRDIAGDVSHGYCVGASTSAAALFGNAAKLGFLDCVQGGWSSVDELGGAVGEHGGHRSVDPLDVVTLIRSRRALVLGAPSAAGRHPAARFRGGRLFRRAGGRAVGIGCCRDSRLSHFTPRNDRDLGRRRIPRARAPADAVVRHVVGANRVDPVHSAASIVLRCGNHLGEKRMAESRREGGRTKGRQA